MISQTDMLFLHLTKTLLLFVFLAVGQFAFAQDEPDFPDMRSWRIRNNDTTDRYIFSDTALIRISPDTRQPPADRQKRRAKVQGHRKQKRHLYLGRREWKDLGPDQKINHPPLQKSLPVQPGGFFVLLTIKACKNLSHL